MSMAIKRLERSITDLPKGVMQTGSHKIKLDLADAERLIIEINALKADRDAFALTLSSYEKTMQELVTTHGLICANSRQHYFERYAELSEVTPQHHLAAHDAEVAVKAVDDFCEWMLLSKRCSVAEWCGEYTKQLRAKAGEL